MWTFQQSTGEVQHNGVHVGFAYSGNGEGINNPAMQEVQGVGPICVGNYTIGNPFTHPKAGPNCMRLAPNAGTETFGRAGFMWHGGLSSEEPLTDEISLADLPPGTPEDASEGCIVQRIAERSQVVASIAKGDNQLQVIS